MKKLLLILILASGPLYGQPVQIPADDASTWSMFTYDMGNLFKGIGYSYTRPLYWGKSQWATFGGMVAATGTVYLFDTQTSEYFTLWRIALYICASSWEKIVYFASFL